MPATTSVVTAARFVQGLSYEDFIKQAAVNQEKLLSNGKTVPLSDEDISFFRKVVSHPRGPVRMLALGEAWCGDVCRELPTAGRIAEVSGMELRVFLRDQNLDIMDEFLSNNGKSRSIPVFVFYTKDMEYLTHWTERSAGARAGLDRVMTEAKTKLNLPQSATFSTLEGQAKQSLLQEVVTQVQPFNDDWRRDSIREIRQRLAEAVGIPNGG